MASTLELGAFSSAGYKSETLRVYKRCFEFPLNCNFMVHSDLCFRKFWWRHRHQTSAHSKTQRGWIRARSRHYLIFSASVPSSRIVVETCVFYFQTTTEVRGLHYLFLLVSLNHFKRPCTRWETLKGCSKSSSRVWDRDMGVGEKCERKISCLMVLDLP